VLDDRRREAMSAVGELIHAGSLPCRATRSNPVSVTLPFYAGPRAGEVTTALDTFVVYDRWVETDDASLLEEIADYNEADCRSLQICAVLSSRSGDQGNLSLIYCPTSNGPWDGGRSTPAGRARLWRSDPTSYPKRSRRVVTA
jgi:hypothetical protein